MIVSTGDELGKGENQRRWFKNCLENGWVQTSAGQGNGIRRETSEESDVRRERGGNMQEVRTREGVDGGNVQGKRDGPVI